MSEEKIGIDGDQEEKRDGIQSPPPIVNKGKNHFSLVRVLIKAIVIISLTYIISIILAFILFLYVVDESFNIKVIDIVHGRQECKMPINQRSADPINPIEFFSNTTYWLASARFSDKILEDDLCVSKIMLSIKNNKRKVSVVFIDENSNVSLAVSN